MVFSKFEFSESPCGKEETNMPSGSKKYKKLLEQVEQRKHKLQQVFSRIFFEYSNRLFLINT